MSQDEKKGEVQFAKSPVAKVMHNVFIVLGFVIVAGLAIYNFLPKDYAPYSGGEDLTTVFEDALYGTSQSDDLQSVQILQDIFAGYQEEIAVSFANTIAIDDPTNAIFEFSSFRTLEALQEDIALIEGSIAELERTEEILSDAADTAREIVRTDESFSEAEKAEFIAGMNQSLNNPERQYLELRRYELLKESNQAMLDVYNYLVANFDNYEIDFDEFGAETIFFFTDESLNGYSLLLDDLLAADLRFLEAEEEFIEYTNNALQQQGLGITVEDVQNSFDF